jgi:VanZ family protein
MQRDHRKWLWWLAVGLWIAVILGFSGDQFSKESTSPILVQLWSWVFPAMSAETQRLLQFLVRKGAHAFEYAVLATLAYQALRDSSNPWRSAALALVLVVAVAVADETYQASSAARSGSAADVGIDAAGGAAALFLLVGIGGRLRVRRRQRGADG